MFNIFYYTPKSLRLYQLQFEGSPIYKIRFETNYQLKERIDSFEISEKVQVAYELMLVLILRKNYQTNNMELHKCDFSEIFKVEGKRNDKIITLTSTLVLEIPMSYQKQNLISIQLDYQKSICHLYFDSEIYLLSLTSLLQKESRAVVIQYRKFKKFPLNPKKEYLIVNQNHKTMLFQTNGQYDGQQTNFQIIVIDNDKAKKQTFQIPYPKSLIQLDEKQTILPQISKAQINDGDEIMIKCVTQIKKYFVIQQITLDEYLTPFLVSEEIRWNESQEYYLEIPSDKSDHTVLLPNDSYTVFKQNVQSQMKSEIFPNYSVKQNHKISENTKVLESVFV